MQHKTTAVVRSSLAPIFPTAADHESGSTPISGKLPHLLQAGRRTKPFQRLANITAPFINVAITVTTFVSFSSSLALALVQPSISQFPPQSLIRFLHAMQRRKTRRKHSFTRYAAEKIAANTPQAPASWGGFRRDKQPQPESPQGYRGRLQSLAQSMVFVSFSSSFALVQLPFPHLRPHPLLLHAMQRRKNRRKHSFLHTLCNGENRRKHSTSASVFGSVSPRQTTAT